MKISSVIFATPLLLTALSGCTSLPQERAPDSASQIAADIAAMFAEGIADDINRGAMESGRMSPVEYKLQREALAQAIRQGR
jgi:hypothetical protein